MASENKDLKKEIDVKTDEIRNLHLKTSKIEFDYKK
jgi:hypothetical protein